MHFSWVCATQNPNDVYTLMEPFQEPEYYGDEYPGNPNAFYDWFEIWWRRAWIITLKKWCKGHSKWDLWLNFTYWGMKLKRWTCSVAQKKDIAHFYKWEKESDAYPHTWMFFDEKGVPHFQPDEILWDFDSRKEMPNPKFKEEMEQFNIDLEHWYENIPDHFYVTIIDYHD